MLFCRPTKEDLAEFARVKKMAVDCRDCIYSKEVGVCPRGWLEFCGNPVIDIRKDKEMKRSITQLGNSLPDGMYSMLIECLNCAESDEIIAPIGMWMVEFFAVKKPKCKDCGCYLHLSSKQVNEYLNRLTELDLLSISNSITE